jgi:hypothetical protein
MARGYEGTPAESGVTIKGIRFPKGEKVQCSPQMAAVALANPRREAAFDLVSGKPSEELPPSGAALVRAKRRALEPLKVSRSDPADAASGLKPLPKELEEDLRKRGTRAVEDGSADEYLPEVGIWGRISRLALVSQAALRRREAQRIERAAAG